jgi:hypothetical protein
LKCELLELYSENYLYHIGPPFLSLCLNTVVLVRAEELSDGVDDIVGEVLQLLERSCSHADYASYFYSSTQLLMLKLFQLVSIGPAERDALLNDPEHFAEIADDFCKTQDANSVKARAGSLIHSLCLSIDGTLTFVSSMCFIPLHYLELQCVRHLSAPQLLRDPIRNADAMMQTLLDLWPRGPEELTETAILISASISDLLAKRAEVGAEMGAHLANMQRMLQEETAVLLTPLLVCRYMQLASFFSYRGCLDAFLPYFARGRAYEENLLKALETLTHYHNKQQAEMREYVGEVTTRVLMMSDRLTPLLETTIVNRPTMVAAVKERLLEKLVVWLQEDYAKANQFGCNKLSNLLCKVVQAYPQLDPDSSYAALTLSLTPLYKQMLGSARHPSEECIIDLAVQHVECLGLQLELSLAQQFLHMGIQVVLNNGYVLNKCLELFSRLLCIVNVQDRPEYIPLTRVHVAVAAQLLPLLPGWIAGLKDERDIDLWQVAYLAEIVLVTLWNEEHVAVCFSQLQQLCHHYSRTKSNVLKVKIYQVVLILFRITPDANSATYQFLQSTPLPEDIPPYEKNNFAIYLCQLVNLAPTPEFKAHLILQTIKLIYPTQRYAAFLKNYEDSIYCSRSDHSETEIAALQTAKEVLHPLNCRRADIYNEFREMFSRMSSQTWEQVRPLVSAKENHIRDALVRQVIGKTPRRILKIKQKHPL